MPDIKWNFKKCASDPRSSGFVMTYWARPMSATGSNGPSMDQQGPAQLIPTSGGKYIQPRVTGLDRQKLR